MSSLILSSLSGYLGSFISLVGNRFHLRKRLWTHSWAPGCANFCHLHKSSETWEFTQQVTWCRFVTQRTTASKAETQWAHELLLPGRGKPPCGQGGVGNAGLVFHLRASFSLLVCVMCSLMFSWHLFCILCGFYACSINFTIFKTLSIN